MPGHICVFGTYIYNCIHVHVSTITVVHCDINAVANIVGFAVIDSLPVIIFRPNEGPVELMCNVSATITAWIINNSPTTLPAAIPTSFPGHNFNGDNLVIINPTNDTVYICASVEGGGMQTKSNPVVLYIAGTYVCVISLLLIFMSI